MQSNSFENKEKLKEHLMKIKEIKKKILQHSKKFKRKFAEIITFMLWFWWCSGGFDIWLWLNMCVPRVALQPKLIFPEQLRKMMVDSRAAPEKTGGFQSSSGKWWSDSRAAPENDGGFQSSSGKWGVDSRAAPESKGWRPEQLRKHQIPMVTMSQFIRKAWHKSKEIIWKANQQIHRN